MEEQDTKAIQFFYTREVKNLYKKLLILLEDSLEREEIGEELYNFLRKRVLDSGNEAIRNLDEQLNNYVSIQKIKSNK